MADFFGLFQIRGFWKDQYLDDDYIGLKLLLGIFGMLLVFWMLPTALTISFSNGFLSSLDDYSGNVSTLRFIQQFWVQFLLGLLLSSLMTIVTYRNTVAFEGFILSDQRLLFEEDIQNTTQEKDMGSPQLWIVLSYLVMLGNGMLAGMFYTLIYIIPYFMIFFLLVFILFNFMSLGSTLFLLATIISWFIFAIYITRNKLHLAEEEIDEDPRVRLPTKREREIFLSDEEPIVCPNCRSFIPATSSSCPVCNETIED